MRSASVSTRLELRLADEGEQPLAHPLVVDRVLDAVARGGAADVRGHLQVDDDRLLDPALPLPDADDAFDRERAEKNLVHSWTFVRSSGRGRAAAACRAASAQWRGSPDRRARRRPGGGSQRTRSSPRCPCRTPAADTAPARPARSPKRRELHCAVDSIRADAAGDDQRRQARLLRAARAHFATSVSTTACWNSQATSARVCSSSCTSRVATTTAVFSPLKLKSRPGRSSIGRGKRNRPGRPLIGELRQRRPARIRQARAASPSCRTPRRRHRRATRR